jgi:aminoglycoside/choline kinase family phosphotransferase
LETEIVLTPAQRSFITAHVDGFDENGWKVTLAGHAGSQRLFYRIKEPGDGGRSFVLVVWDSKDEDWLRFLSIPRELSPHINVLPAILFSDDCHGLILEEDLGDHTLKSAVSDGLSVDEKEALFRRVVDSLRLWHRLDIKLSLTISSRALDYEVFMWETDYFARRCVVDFCGAERLLTKAWKKERTALAAQAAALPKCFVHRDFQSENIILKGAEVKYVDFQGARLGPPAYDLASLLYDPYLDILDDMLIERLLTYYCTLDQTVSIDAHSFYLCAAQRLMQALGAYGNLSIHQGKTRYRSFVPVALSRLCRVLECLPEYPALSGVALGCREAVVRTIGE